MRLFTQFGSCWGGAVISPAAEPLTDDRQTADHVVYSHRNRRLVKARSRGGAATHWKPKLNAISENSPVTDVNRVRPAGIGNKKALKVKPKSPAPSLDSWKSSEAMAVPAFSPMSFMF